MFFLMSCFIGVLFSQALKEIGLVGVVWMRVGM